MTADTYLYTIFWFVVMVVSIVAARMITNIVQARTKLADEGQYRQLAERTVAALEEQTGVINALRSDLSAARASLANVEKILKQVE